MSVQSALPVRRGLPFWVIPAVLPLALSLGFVAGMGLAHYRLLEAPEPSQAAPVQTPVAGEAPTPSADQPLEPLETATLSPAHVQPAPLPSAGPGTVTKPLDPKPSVPVVPPNDSPVIGKPSPDQVYTPPKPSLPTVATLEEARLALQNDRTGIGLIPGLEYEEMRNSDGSVSLVGMLSAEEYLTWEATLRRDAGALQRSLQAAADLVLSPAQQDSFALSWALVETRVSVPNWALPSEVTPLEDGRFLIVRYLAGTVGLRESKVEIRSLDSLGTQADPNAAWSRFGPQIRFDGTDIYRPSDSQPKSP